MGKASRDKGARIELKMVKLLKGSGIEVEKVPLSGARHGTYGGDLKLADGRLIEVKGRQKKDVFWRQVEKFLEGNSYLFLCEDRVPEPIVAMSYAEFVRLLAGKE